jgi:hypothetical protein
LASEPPAFDSEPPAFDSEPPAFDSEQLPQAAIASGVLRYAQNSKLKSATRI